MKRLESLRIGGLMALAATSLSAPAYAAAPSAPMRWIVDWDDHQCRLLRLAPENPLGLEIRSITAEIGVRLTIGNDDWKADPRKGTKAVDVLFLPQGTRMSVQSDVSSSEKGQRVIIHDLEKGFLDQLAESDGLALEAAGERLAEFRFSSADAAVRQLNTCNRNLLAEWGIDVDMLDRLQRKATPVTKPWMVFSPSDYPSQSLRRHSGGTVVALYTVTAEGKVEGCVAVRSSGDRWLDERTCQILERRLRYHPAVGLDGQPVAVRTAIPVKWAVG